MIVIGTRLDAINKCLSVKRDAIPSWIIDSAANVKYLAVIGCVGALNRMTVADLAGRWLRNGNGRGGGSWG